MKVVFLANHFEFFVSHRLALALRLKKKGFEVTVLAGHGEHSGRNRSALESLMKNGINVKSVCLRSHTANLASEVASLLHLGWQVYRLGPDLIHCVSPKMILYGAIVGRVVKVDRVVLAVSGMGYLFTKDVNERKSLSKSLLKSIYKWLLGLFINGANVEVIVQNSDDCVFFKTTFKKDTRLIPGSGVNTVALGHVAKGVIKEKIVVFPGRFLKHKGIHVFMEAASTVKKSHPEWRFILAGDFVDSSPSAVERELVETSVSRGCIENFGFLVDLPALLARASIVCLPSFREGMPKVLLEGSALGCAVVTSDAIGCRESVEPGVTGDIVPVGDVRALALTLIALINDPDRIARYGRNGRLRAEQLYSLDKVVEHTLKVYGSKYESA